MQSEHHAEASSCCVQALYLWVVDPRYNMFLIKLLFFYMLTLLALFGQFFYQKHVAGSKSSKRKAL